MLEVTALTVASGSSTRVKDTPSICMYDWLTDWAAAVKMIFSSVAFTTNVFS